MITNRQDKMLPRVIPYLETSGTTVFDDEFAEDEFLYGKDDLRTRKSEEGGSNAKEICDDMDDKRMVKEAPSYYTRMVFTERENDRNMGIW